MSHTNDAIPFPTIHAAFEARATIDPDRSAVTHDGYSLTYGELNGRANQLAQRLARKGACPNKLVGVVARRSVDLPAAVLGILKTGAAFVPIDPSYPDDRVLFLRKDARFDLVVAPDEISCDVFGGQVEAVLLDDSTLRDECKQNPNVEVSGADLAYVIYTSGTTGYPNGVMIEHHSVMNLANGLRRTVYSDYTNRPLTVALNAPLVFDASIKQIVQLLFGHALHILPDRLRRNPAGLVTWLRESGINVFDCTPSQLRLLMDAGLDDSMAPPSIVLVGGESIDPPLWDRLAQSKTVDYYNVYGPTECTVDATVARVTSYATPNIGMPIPNVAIQILDGDVKPVAVDQTGELYVSGEGVARGYWNRPELTAERFADRNGARMYKTGDMVRALPGGGLEFLGRADDQIKLRGYRIELGEIESVLRRHPAVADAAAFVRADGPEDQRLVACVVPTKEEASPLPQPLSPPGKGEQWNAGALRAYLVDRLPEFMIPSTFAAVEAIPLTVNGKIDRKALAAMLAAGDEQKPVDALLPADMPHNALEKVLCGLCANVLGIDSIGIHDNFFEMGGHSLLATQFIAQLQDLFPSEEPLLGVFFQEPTIAALSNAIIENAGGVDVEQIAAVIQSVMTLSDDEVDAMLASEVDAARP